MKSSDITHWYRDRVNLCFTVCARIEHLDGGLVVGVATDVVELDEVGLVHDCSVFELVQLAKPRMLNSLKTLCNSL